jgi:hypothetical protein
MVVVLVVVRGGSWMHVWLVHACVPCRFGCAGRGGSAPKFDAPFSHLHKEMFGLCLLFTTNRNACFSPLTDHQPNSHTRALVLSTNRIPSNSTLWQERVQRLQ